MSLSELLRELREMPSHEQEADEWGGQAQSQRKKVRIDTPLGLGIRDDFFTVPGIRERPLPREDGYPADAADEWIAPTRPFGRDYLNEQAERERILSQNKDYRFQREIAGALRKEPLEVVEEEDLARVMRERAEERRAAEAETRRTKLTIAEKSDAVRKLNDLLAEVRGRYNHAQSARADVFLVELSRRLIDRDTATGFLQLYDQVREYMLLKQLHEASALRDPAHADTIWDLERLDTEENEEFKAAWLASRSLAQQYFAFAVFIYFRDFLDQQSDMTMRESFQAKRDYLIRITPLAQNDQAVDAKDVAMPPVLLADTTLPVPWERFRDSDTLDLQYFDRLGVTSDAQQRMIRRVQPTDYDAALREELLTFAYTNSAMPDWEEKRFAALRPLLARLEGLPLGVNGAFVVNERQARQVVRAHLLWVYYDKRGLTDVVQQLFDHQSDNAGVASLGRIAVFGAISETTAAVLGTKSDDEPTGLFALYAAYQVIVEKYLNRVREYLSAQRSLLGQTPVFQLPGDAVDLRQQDDYRVEADVVKLVQDALFSAYLREGQRAFKPRDTEEALVEEGRARTRPLRDNADLPEVKMPAPYVTPPTEYPALALHWLFERYRQFLADYALFAGQELRLGEQAITKARDKIARILGDERVDRSDRSDPLLYQQRKSFTALPINSGFIKFKAEIKTLINRAWHNTQRYAPGLHGLPLEGFQSDAAFDSGLCTRFCEYVAALYAYKDLSIQQQYNSQHHTAHCHKALHEAFHPLHAYSWAPDGFGAYRIGGGSTYAQAVARYCSTMWRRSETQ